ncbi:MAG: Gfo/Idh/MocA family oxidoreductase [Lachnospiraceae bacterium]|nr:Gfo/Idh/MocA family oxidoreductase [Lachnospiraceae bacterium]MDD7328006.1 Gfo/Idh/MocA family oxidoreductase [Lachnospiraceae bacterium]MDY2759946.1 Gfo/Idh/MocA family oxidoreductase [Lachnospiraceae bacterium]
MVRIGVIGSGNIAARFIKEASYVSDVQVTAIYNPHIDSARRLSPELATDDWNFFIKKIDAGYIAVPHLAHMTYVKQLVHDRKHILCEKPMSLSFEELRQVSESAAHDGLVCMEALKTAYAPGFLQLLRDVKKIGRIFEVDAAFTKLMQPNGSRVFRKDCAGGSFTELASYTLLPVALILGTSPQEIRFHTFYGDDSEVDIYSKAILMYDNAVADIRVGIGAKTEGNLVVTGSKGYILAPSPWWLTKQYDICFEDRTKNIHVEAPFDGDGLRYEIQEFVRLIEAGETVPQKMQEVSLFMAKVMEDLIAQ